MNIKTNDIARIGRRQLSAVADGVQGFTLIEVLVALIVLSLGLLGIAALQGATVQFNREAYLRSQATSLAYNMADRMRANRQAALNGAYDVAYADPAPDCGGAAGAGTVAAQDVAAWLSAVACVLPQGNGTVDVVNSVVTIGVRWNEAAREGEDDEALEFEMVTGL